MTFARVSIRQIAYVVLAGVLLAASILFFGAFQSHADVVGVSLSSTNKNPLVAKIGDSVTLSFTNTATSSMPAVLVDGHSVALTGGPNVWSARYTLTPNDAAGAVTFSITDASGVITNTSDTSYVTFFPASPVAQLYSIDATPNSSTSLKTVRVMAIFSEPVTNVTPSSFTTVNATVTNVTASPGNQVYVATIIPAAAGAFSVTIPSNQAMDVAGNTTSGSAMLSFAYDPTGSTGMTGASAEMMSTTTMTETTPVVTPSESAMTTSKNTRDTLMGTSSILIGSSTAMASDTASTTGMGTSGAVWLGIIAILILLVGGGWWYSRNVMPTA
jgi:hypothetical protein